MEDTVLILLIFVLLVVGGTLGGIYYSNRHLVVPGTNKKPRKKDKQNWSIGGS